MNPEFTYFAHISYITEDESLAKKMQHQLEHYRLPGKLARKFPHLPRKIRPVCRNTPAAAGDGPREALAASRYLIVICTPASARADASGKYPLDDDITTFLSLRAENAERVIPIIFPPTDASSAKDCLSPALLALNVLAADVREKGTERALNDVVAKMLNLSPNTLWDRRRREQIRNRWICGTGAALAAGLTAAAGWYWWDYNTPHVSYYTDYIERNNLPEGLFPLSEEQMSRRTVHYRFTHCRRQLQKVEFCSSSGKRFEHLLPWNNSRPSGMKFEYTSNTGELTGCTLLDAEGETTDHLSFSGNFIDSQKRLKSGTTNNRGVNRSYSYNIDTAFAETFSESGIERTVVQRNAAGLVTRRLFYRQNSFTPALDARGIGGLEYELDDKGRVLTERYIRQEQEPGKEMRVVPAATPSGVGGMRFTYGENGLISTVTSIDKEGNAVMNDNQWAQVTIGYDHNGNANSFHYLDTWGNPCTNGYGYSRSTTTHDERGNEIEDRFFDIEGRICSNKLFGAARIVYTYSAQGAIASMSTYDTTGKLCPGPEGYARVNFTYNQQGELARESYLDTNGEPCLNVEGIAHRELEYNEQGKIILRKHLGTDGKPCTNRDGVAQERSVYDEQGNQTEQAFYDVQGNLCTNKAGYARSCALYHAENSNLIGITYYGADGNRCSGPEGFSRRSWAFAPNGKLLRDECFDEKDAPCAGPDGITRVEWTYSSLGIPESATSFRVDGSYVRMALDEQGKPTEEANFRADGSPLANERGFIRQTIQRDAQTGSTTFTAFQADGSHSRLTTDKLGRPVEQSVHDAQGKPIPNAMGAVRVTTAYNAQGGIASITSYRADGSYSTMNHRETGTETAYFNADGTPSDAECGYARLCLEPDADMGLMKMDKFDIHGNKVETAYITPKGQPQLCKEGYALMKREYDAAGNCIRSSFFDTAGKPCLQQTKGCASWTTRYDAQKRPIEQSYYDLEGKPCLSSGGYARMASKYNAQGREEEIAYYGLDGQPCLVTDGFARVTWKYDERGNKTEMAHYGTDGRLCLTADGYARATWRYDEQGHQVEDACYGTDGKPCLHKEGYARIVRKHDASGEVSELAYFGTDGKPCLITDGYARAVFLRDAANHTKIQAFYGVDGKPCLHKDGYARMSRRYDARGNLLEMAWFGTDGKPCAGEGGASRTVIEYDARGNMVSYTAYDAEGKVISSM